MIILRNKLFGKFDNVLAKKLGKTVKQIRVERLGHEGGKTAASVNDLINAGIPGASHKSMARRGYRRPGPFQVRLRINNRSEAAQKVQQDALERFKVAKKLTGGDSKKAYEMIKPGNEALLNRKNTEKVLEEMKLKSYRDGNALKRLTN